MISIIVPTYNEEENIADFLNQAEFFLKGINHEIIIVDDGTDKTSVLALETARSKEYPVRVYKREKKKGLTSAILEGIKFSKGDFIAIMDADLQHPPELLPKLFAEIKKGNDVVIASRYIKGAKFPLSIFRKLISKAGVFAMHLCVQKTRAVKDPLANFIIFKKEFAKDINPDAIRILPELLIKEEVKKVVEIPCTFNLRKAGKTKILNSRNILAGLVYALKLGKKTKEQKRIAKFFAVGASSLVVNEGLLWLLTGFAGLFYLISSVIAIEASILFNFVLNDSWTFRKQRKGRYFGRLGRFNLARIFAAGINFGILWLLTSLGLHYLVSNLIGAAFATIFTYLTSILWVWK